MSDKRLEILKRDFERIKSANPDYTELCYPIFFKELDYLFSEIERLKQIETYGKWTHEKVWIYRNERGDIMRAQDEHPASASEEVGRMYRSDADESNHERL